MAAPVQIVWSFDTTGSMSSCLESVKTQIQDLSQRLLRDIPTLEIGLIAHGDYCDLHSSYLIKTMPFSTDPAKIKAWVSGVGPTGGGDAPEAYEIALRAAVNDFAWKKDARKVVALIGDEVPHEASFPSNTDNVDWNVQLELLAELGVRVFGIQCLHNSHATSFYKALAERTDGLWLHMKDLKIIKDVFLAVCLQVADTKAFDQFRSQLAADGPVASALVPLMLRLAKKKQLSKQELAALCGVVGKLASEHGRPPKEVFLPIDRVEVSASVHAGSCEVELVQTFTNKREVVGEASSFEYRFPLPRQGAVFHFEAELSSGRVVKGILKAREEARKDYQRAISRGSTAFLMEEQNADIFSMQLGNLAPEETVKIVLKFVTELEKVDIDRLRLRLPQHVAPRCGGEAVNGMLICCPIRVQITSTQTSGIDNIQSLTHGGKFTNRSDLLFDSVSGCLELGPEDGVLNSDLVFDMHIANLPGNIPKDNQELTDISIACEHCDETGSTILQVAVTAPVLDKVPSKRTKIAIVLDGSCSMQGPNFDQAKHAATQVLSEIAALCSDVMCTCLLMQHKTSTMCDYKPILDTKAIVDAWHGNCGGGTNFLAAFDALSTLAEQADATIVISDGHGPETIQPILRKAQETGQTFFCMGVGSDPGLELLEALADITGGVCEVAASHLEQQTIAKKLASAIAACSLEAKIEIPGVEKSMLWPAKFVTYPGRRAVAYVHLEHQCHLEYASVNGEKVPILSTSRGRVLHRLGARKRISELERLNHEGTNDDAICKLSLAHGLMSSRTSFVGVDEAISEKYETSSLGSEEESGRMPCCAMARIGSEEESGPMPRCAMARRRSLSLAEDRDSLPEIACVEESLNSVRDVMMESCDSVLTRGESLDELCSRSACLKESSACFMKSASRMSRPSMKRRAVGAMSKLTSATASRVANMGKGLSEGFFSKLKTKGTSSDPLGALSEEPMEAAALPGCHRYFKGVLQHAEFGLEEVTLTLIIDRLNPDGEYLGRWTAMGQTEHVAIVLDVARESVTIKDQSTKLTVLQGSYDKVSGFISGEVYQNGVGGGRFHLKADIAYCQFKDSDGDRLVFVRLLGVGVAEYCNGRLVVSSIQKLRVDRGSGNCDDGSGTFTIPSDRLPATLDELLALLKGASVEWEDVDSGRA
jgi:hypothetical protein